MISNLLKSHAVKKSTPLQINFLKNTINVKSKKKLFLQSKFLHKELSIRLSHRVFNLLELPYGIPMIYPVKNVIDLYCSSFEDIQKFRIREYDDIIPFSNLLMDIKDKHGHIEEDISKGLSIMKNNLDNNLINFKKINYELDNFFLSRISIRTLISQNYEIINNGKSLVQDCNLKNIISGSIYDVTTIADRLYNWEPIIELKNDEKIIFPYIPSHIYYIINEILKNSIVAHFKDGKKEEPITVEFIEGKNDIIIKITDNANSFPIGKLSKMLSYSYSTEPINIIEEFELTNSPIISGFGFGLPMARLYANYFGGNLVVNPMENKGTEVYIYINKIGNNSEKLII